MYDVGDSYISMVMNTFPTHLGQHPGGTSSSRCSLFVLGLNIADRAGRIARHLDKIDPLN